MKIVKPITADIPKSHWLSIWTESPSSVLSDTVRETTWDRLCDADVPLFGLMAYHDDRTPVGFLHYALHPITGAVEPAAYMQDLYILPAYRRRGHARSLIQALVKQGQSERWDRISWFADRADADIRKLYDECGTMLEFDLYIHPIGMLRRLMN